LFEGAEILWVDDRPSNNRNEARMLRSFGALITFAATTEEALHALRAGVEQHQPFEIILSDISRDLTAPDPTGGLAMLSRVRDAGFHQPVIFYVGRPNPNAGVPAGAFGITHRPDQLLQLTIDALSRIRGGT
jgi:CheY-like chemotaxis protein